MTKPQRNFFYPMYRNQDLPDDFQKRLEEIKKGLAEIGVGMKKHTICSDMLQAIEKGLVKLREGKYYMMADYESAKIKYCPFCGERLKPYMEEQTEVRES